MMDLSLTYRALADRRVDLIAGNSTDGLISALDLFQLEDDRRYFPPYEAAPVIRSAALEKHPALRQVFQSLAGKVNDQTMRELNYAVDGQHKEARDVVSQFLAHLER
jgi:glycine betaine/choline ABC-type transport system substrate-binding protein